MAKNPFSNTTSKKNKDTDDSVFQAVTQKAYRRAVESRRDPSPASSPIYQSKVEMPTTQTVAPAGNSAAVTPPTTDAATRKNQIEARLKQIDSEYSTTATVLSGYQRGGLQKSNAYLTAKERADSLKMEKQELEKELQTVYKQMAAGEGYREANFIDNTWNSFNRGRYNSLLGKESYDALWETDNEKKKYEDILAGDDYMFVPSNKFEQAVSGVMEQLGQQYVQATDPRSVAMAGTAGTAAFIAGQVGPQVLVPEEVITVPSAMIAGWQVGSSMSNLEIEAGLAYNEMLENGVSPETAKKVAMAVGGVNAALELVQLDELTKSFKILKSNPATVSAADSLGKRLLDMGGEVAKSVGKETAQEVAQEATTIHGVQQATKKDTGKKAYTAEEVGDRLVDTAISSAMTFGLMNVPHATVGTMNAVLADRVGNQYIDNVDALVEEGMQSDQNSESYKIASRLKERLDNGEKVSNTEAYDLAVANARAIDTERKLQIANTPSTPVESSVETPAPTRVQTIQSRLTEVGMEATEAEGVAQTIDRILNGDTTVTSKDKDVLRVGNSAARQVFEEESGVKLPASNSSTRKAVSEYIAQAALKQQKQESTATVAENATVVNQPPVNVMSTEAINQLKGSVSMPTAPANTAEVALRQAAQAVAEGNAKVNAAKVETTVATVGAKGQVVYQKHLPNAKNVAAYTRAFERYYDAGQIGYPLERMTSEYAEGVDPKALVEAYNAGAEDASLPSEGKPTIKNKNAQKGIKTPSKSKGRFYDNRTIEGKAVAEKDVVALKQFAKVFNIDIELVDSIDVGDVKSAANGYYSRSERKIYLAADSDNPLMTVLKHEVTHHIQRVSPKQYKALKDYVMKAYYNNSQEAMNAEIQIRIADAAAKKVHLTRSAAMDEIVADATEVFLTDRDSIDALVRENRSLAETILNAIRDVLHKIEAAMRGVKVEGKHSFFMDVDQIKTAEKMWVEALADAANSEIGVNDVVISESSVPVWSLKSMKFDLLDGQMQRDLVEHGILTLEESQRLMDEISKLIDKMSPFAHIVDMNEEYSKDNRPFAVYKPNSDPLYKVSLDFSTLCKKRLMTQFVIESLQTKLGKAMSAKEQIAIRSKLEEYGKVNEQIQVACALCYVEARRLKAPDQINRFLDDRTTILTDYFGKKNKDYKKKVDDMADQMKVEMGYKADTKLKDMKPSDKKKVNEAKQKMMKEYIPSAEEQKIIERANAIDNAEFLNQAGLTRLNLNEPVIYDAFVSHVRNATKSKALEGGVPYYYGDSKSVSDSLIEAMNAENGLRHQSWSDFEIVHLLDTIAAVIDLSVRKAKMQSYTKVPAFVHVNGNTGMMINLSLIPAGKNGIKDGKLDFSPTEGMDYAVAVDLRDQYHKTTGTIAIGIDDKQIEMLLDDPTIDYVIPYHTSGMNAQLRKMAGISGWVDYESFQSEKEIKGAKQGDCPDELWHKKPDFSEWFDTSKLDMSKSGVEIMREAAGRYLVMCEERGLHPKFSNTKQHTDFSKHENYWKLLIDRKMVDGDGNIIIQQAVRPNFDFDKISEVVDMEIKNYDPALLDSINEKIMKEWESGGIKQREAELLKDEKTKKKAAKVANGLVEQVVKPEGAKKIITDDGDGQFSFKTLPDGTQYVKLDGNIFLNEDGTEKTPREAYNTLVDKKFVLSNGDVVRIIKALPGRKDMYRELFKKRPVYNANVDIDEFNDRLNRNFPEVLERTELSKADEPDRDKKHEKFWVKSFDYRKVLVADDSGAYELTLAVANLTDGRKVAYAKQYVEEKPELWEKIKKAETQSKSPQNQPSGKSVAQPDPSVNDFSFKDSVEMESDLDALRQERTDLEDQLDEAYFDDAPAAEIRKLNNRLTKVNADIDKIVAEERKAAVLTPMQTILDNLSNYRRSDLESLAEQISRGAWDDYEEMSRSDLEDALREVIRDRELSPLEMQSKQFGLRVRPVETPQYQLKTPDEMLDISKQIAAEEHKAKAVTDAEIMSQVIKDMKLTGVERDIVKNYQDAMKKLADYEKDLAVYEATKGEHGKGRSIYTDASGKVKKSGLKYSAEERAEIQRKVEWWKRRLREIEQKEEFKKILKREKAKMAERHAKEVADIRAKYDQRLSDLRAKRDEKVEAEKQRLRDYKQFQRDSKEYKALKAKLESDVKWLNERLVHPTDAKHIPEEFKKGVAAFLNSLDFESKYTDSYEVRNGKPSQKVINLRELNEVYDEILKDQSSMMELDETMLEALKELEKICENKRVADLDYAELGLVRDAIEYIKMSVAVANKAFNADIKKTISEMGEALIQELRSMKSKKDRAGIVGEADKLLNYDNVAPADKFHELGGVMEMLYKEIRKGFDKHINNVQTAIDYTQKLTSGHEEAIKAWSGDKAKVTKFQISDGTTIELTPAQVMSLYCLMKREQALGHVLGSGIVPSGVVVKESKKYGKVKLNVAKKVSAERASRCTIEDIQKIVGTLTDDQKRVADGVAKLFTTKCADWGNETSMRLYGYKKFNEKNYFPIKSSDAYLNARFDDSGDVLIKNLGFTKNTVVKANNPIVVEDIFDVLADHVNKMSMYNALVVPLTDFTRVFNYKSKNTDNTIYDSVQKALETAGGRLGVQYIKQFMKDVNRQAASLVEESLGNKALSNYKKAKIGANLRVLAQQPTAIVRAAAMVDPKYLIKGLQQKANYEEMFNNSEIAYWKSLGFYQTDMGRNMKDILLDNESKLDQLTMSMYGKADDFAWGHLWNAIKLEVADTHPNVDKTSSEFVDLVKVRFDEVVDRTQVVDSVFHRSQLMRSGSLFTKMVTAFMAEPTKSYNLLRSDLNDSIRTKDYSKFKRSAVTFVANAILVSAFAGFVDMIRDDDDEDEEGNKRTLADKYLDATVSNIADNVIPLNLIPYIKDIVSIGKGYDVNRMDMAAVTQFMTVARKWTTGKYSAPYLLKETVGALADLVGIPLKNAVRDVAALTRTAGDIVGGHYYADYFASKCKYNIANPDNRSVFYKHYTDALLDGDEKAAEMILADMVVNGIPYDNIIAKGYQKEKEITFSEARKLIADGKDDDARKLVRELANKYDKKYTTLWKAVRNGDSAGEPEETYDFNDFKKAVKKGEDTELIEDYLTEYGGYSEEDLEEAVKLLTGGK